MIPSTQQTQYKLIEAVRGRNRYLGNGCKTDNLAVWAVNHQSDDWYFWCTYVDKKSYKEVLPDTNSVGLFGTVLDVTTFRSINESNRSEWVEGVLANMCQAGYQVELLDI
jgi:hypothetical protein